MDFQAVFTKEKEGGYSVAVPALPGCHSQGETFEEAQQNITEAIQLYLEDADEETQALLHDRGSDFLASVSV
jgi:predicted RNase H-like HicB family nuclease